MSLLRLLAVGRSLSGIAGPNHRYRLGSAGLPKFNSSPASNRGPRTFADNESEAALHVAEPDPFARAVGAEVPRLGGGASRIEASVPVAREIGAERPLADRRIDQKHSGQKHRTAALPMRQRVLNFLTRWLLGSRRGKAGQRRLVQAELSLDSVKVVRNDLTDCDIEPRFASAKPLPVAAPVAEAVSPSQGLAVESKPTAKWNELRAKLLAVGLSRLR